MSGVQHHQVQHGAAEMLVGGIDGSNAAGSSGQGVGAPVTQAAAFLPRPRALALTPGECSSPDRGLALAMEMHPRLGHGCLLNEMDWNLLRIILDHSEELPTMQDFIVLNLHSKFPGLLLPWAVNQPVSVDDAAA